MGGGVKSRRQRRPNGQVAAASASATSVLPEALRRELKDLAAVQGRNKSLCDHCKRFDSEVINSVRPFGCECFSNMGLRPRKMNVRDCGLSALHNQQ